MTWILLAIAIGAEIVGTLLLKLSDGFTKLWPSVGVVLGYY
jgi:small multidrug resistance pump